MHEHAIILMSVVHSPIAKNTANFVQNIPKVMAL